VVRVHRGPAPGLLGERRKCMMSSAGGWVDPDFAGALLSVP
jgi:hypothetical protein